MVENPAQKGVYAIRNKAILELLYGAGIRVGEAQALNISDVDLEERLVRVLGKGNKERLSPFGPPAQKAIKMWLQMANQLPSKNQALFKNPIGQRVFVVLRILTRRQCGWQCARRVEHLGQARPDPVERPLQRRG